ncbi:MAG: hypothetical protein U1E63_15800 [Burkholderiales bacterium]
MSANQTTRAFPIVLAVTGALLGTAPVQAADPVEHAPPVMNQASVYESTLKFYLHPARLELGSEPRRERTDHPAVIVARRASTGSANVEQIGVDPTAQMTRHPATLAKASQLPVIQTTQVSPQTAGK